MLSSLVHIQLYTKTLLFILMLTYLFRFANSASGNTFLKTLLFVYT